MNVSRRGFLQLMGAIGAGVALRENLLPGPKRWEELPEEIDVEFVDSHALGLFILNSRGQEHSVGSLREISGPSYELELIDITSHDSDYREFLPSRNGKGELNATVVGHASPKMHEAFMNRTLLNLRMRLGSYYAYDFSGYVEAYEVSACAFSQLETIFKLKLTGPVTIV